MLRPAQEITLSQLQKLQALDPLQDTVCYLEPPLRAAPANAGFESTSRTAVLISGAYCMAGDVALFEDPTDGQVNFGKVEMHALQNGKAFTCVSVWPVSGVNELRPDKSQKWYPTTCVNGCLIWHTLPNGVVKIVPQKF